MTGAGLHSERQLLLMARTYSNKENLSSPKGQMVSYGHHSVQSPAPLHHSV